MINDNFPFNGLIQGTIEGISATREEFEDGYQAWKVSIEFRQEIGIAN